MKSKNYLIFLLLIVACNNPEKKKQTVSTIKKETVATKKPIKTKEGKDDYLQLIDLVNKRQFNKFDGLEYQFINDYENSIFLDSAQQLKKIVKHKRDSLNIKRDSLRSEKSFKYFQSLNLPQLDTINYDSYELWSYKFPYEFTEVDRDLFNSTFEESWYISYQPMKNTAYAVTVGHFNDCENYIYLYSLDSQFNLNDKKKIYINGCFMFDEDEINHKNYTVNKFNLKTTTYFHNDSSFSIQMQDIYQLTDTLSGEKIKRTGRKEITRYQTDDYGRFVEIDKKIVTEPFISNQQ
jgi:hypothetical protein